MQDSLQRDFSQLAESLSFAQNCISNNEDVCPAPIGLSLFCLERKRLERFGMFLAGGRTSRQLLQRQVRTFQAASPYRHLKKGTGLKGGFQVVQERKQVGVGTLKAPVSFPTSAPAVGHPKHLSSLRIVLTVPPFTEAGETPFPARQPSCLSCYLYQHDTRVISKRCVS